MSSTSIRDHSKHRTFGFGCALLCLIPPAAVEAVAGSPAARLTLATPSGDRPLALTLSADRLVLEQPTGKAAGAVRLRGNVHLQVGLERDAKRSVLELQATRMTVHVDPNGHPLRLEAVGGVRLRAGKRRGKAQRMELAVPSRVITLVGDAELTAPGLGLTLGGTRVRIALDSGRVTVQRARARLSAAGRSGSKHRRVER